MSYSLTFSVIKERVFIGTNKSIESNGISPQNYAGTVEIPIQYKGKPVLEIGQQAFNECHNIKLIIIYANIIIINRWAFYGCSSLERINIPPTVTAIGRYSFCGQGSGIASGTITIVFEGKSQLKYVDSGFCYNKDSIIIHYCGSQPIPKDNDNFVNINSLTIFSSSLTSFIGKTTTPGNCPIIYFQKLFQTAGKRLLAFKIILMNVILTC